MRTVLDMEHLDKLRDKSLSVIHFGTFYVVLPWLGSSCNTLYSTGTGTVLYSTGTIHLNLNLTEVYFSYSLCVRRLQSTKCIGEDAASTGTVFEGAG